MRAVPLVRCAAIWPFAEVLQKLGIPVDPNLAAAGAPSRALESPDLLMPERPLWVLLDRVRRCEGIPDIGFILGASHRVTDIEGLGPRIRNRPTLLDTLHSFCAVFRSHANNWDYWLEPYAGGVRLCRRSSPIKIGAWPIEQYVTSYLVDVVRMGMAEGVVGGLGMTAGLVHADEQREVDHPQVAVRPLGDRRPTEPVPQLAQHLTGGVPLIGDQQEQIVGFGRHLLDEGLALVVGQELGHR